MNLPTNLSSFVAINIHLKVYISSLFLNSLFIEVMKHKVHLIDLQFHSHNHMPNHATIVVILCQLILQVLLFCIVLFSKCYSLIVLNCPIKQMWYLTQKNNNNNLSVEQCSTILWNYFFVNRLPYQLEGANSVITQIWFIWNVYGTYMTYIDENYLGDTSG